MFYIHFELVVSNDSVAIHSPCSTRVNWFSFDHIRPQPVFSLRVQLVRSTADNLNEYSSEFSEQTNVNAPEVYLLFSAIK